MGGRDVVSLFYGFSLVSTAWDCRSDKYGAGQMELNFRPTDALGLTKPRPSLLSVGLRASDSHDGTANGCRRNGKGLDRSERLGRRSDKQTSE